MTLHAEQINSAPTVFHHRNPAEVFTSGELLLSAIVVALLLIAQIIIANPHTEYYRGYWLDEYFTWVIASDPNPVHALYAMRHGMGGMPPLFYSLAHLAHRLIGGPPIAAYRIFSTVAMWIALLAMYATLRHAAGRLTSAVAVLVVWTHPLMARYAFEARPYAMMFAGAACLAWGLRLRGWIGIVMTFLAAVFTCTIHYLGLIPVAGMLLAELIFGPDTTADRIKRIIPGAIGACAFIPGIPLMLQQHRSTGAGWVQPISAHSTVQLLDELFFPLPLLAVLFFWWANRLLGIPHDPVERTKLRRLVPMFAMFFVPAIAIGYSMTRQSMMVDRYMLVTLIAIPALVILPLAETSTALKTVLLILFLFGSTIIVRWNAVRLAGSQAYFDAIAQQAKGNHYPLIFDLRNDALPVWFQHPELHSRIAQIDLSPSGSAPLPRLLNYAHHTDGETQQLYDFPPMWNVSTIAKHGPFIAEFNYCMPEIQKLTPLQVLDQRRDIYKMSP